MIKSLLYMAPIALVGLVATEASAAPAAWSGSIGRNITATVPEGTGVPLVLVCQRGGEAVAAAVQRGRRPLGAARRHTASPTTHPITAQRRSSHSSRCSGGKENLSPQALPWLWKIGGRFTVRI